MIWGGLELGVQWRLASALATHRMLTGVSRACERLVTSRSKANRLRRDADLNNTGHRDAWVFGRLRAIRYDAWRKDGRDQ